LIRGELPPVAGAPAAATSSFVLIFTSKEGLAATDPRFIEGMKTALAPLRADPRVASVLTPDSVAAASAPGLRSKDGKRALANVTVTGTTTAAEGFFPQLRALVRTDAFEVLATGNIPLNGDIDGALDRDLQRAELVSLPLAFVLLLLVFGSAAAALLTLGVGVIVIVAGLGATFALARATDVSQYALNIVTLIGLGVAIDYSLFIVSRFREELAHGRNVEDAVGIALGTAGRAILFSGITVAIGLAGMLFYPGTFLVSLGVTGSLVVAAAVLYALTFLPALLSIFGPRVGAWRLPLPRGRSASGVWHAIATTFMRPPLLVLVPTIALIPIAIGFVTLTTMLALFLLLGSVVLPLKAVAMNALSVSASFGALVWIIQQGHLADILNFTPQSIEPSLPVIMFCIMFGLSMDYEVLLLSRIQEEYLRTGDNTAAVASGLERSGRLITGAAAIMVGVFVAFALAGAVIIH